MKYLFTVALHTLLCSFLFSQTLQDSRQVNWSIAGVEGGIPCVSNEASIFNVLDYGGSGNGTTDNYNAIQSAITAGENAGVPINVIYFPEGDYLIKTSIRVPSNTIIRGESAQKSKLIFDLNGTNSPSFDTPIWKFSDYTDVTSGFTKGSTTLTVVNSSDFVVDEWLEIEQENDPTKMYTSTQWDQSWAAYSKGQFVRVVSISGNTITIDRPLHTDYDNAFHIRARKATLAENIGFENFYITRPNTGDAYTIQLKNVCNTWIRGVHSYRSNKSHVSTERAVNFEVRGSYFERSYNYSGGGHGYGVSIAYHSDYGLVENNIFNRLRHHMIISKGATGNVFGYNYSFDRVQGNGTDTTNVNQGWIPPDISIHGHWSYMNLFEGNISHEAHSADFWGPSGPGTTFFRNRFTSQEGVELDDGSVDQNVVGNVFDLGSITEDATVTGSFIHGNHINGVTNWNPGSGQDNIIDSYYLSGIPSWWTSGTWPSIGPESLSGTNPAKERWENNERAIHYDVSCTVTNTQPQVALNKLSLFPNPTRDFFEINGLADHTYQIRIINSSGVIVKEQTVHSNVKIPVSSLTEGVYSVEIINHTEKTTRKLLIGK